MKKLILLIALLVITLLIIPIPHDNAGEDVCKDHDSVGVSLDFCTRWVSASKDLNLSDTVMFDMLRHAKEATTPRKWTRKVCMEENAQTRHFNEELRRAKQMGSTDKSKPFLLYDCSVVPTQKYLDRKAIPKHGEP